MEPSPLTNYIKRSIKALRQTARSAKYRVRLAAPNVDTGPFEAIAKYAGECIEQLENHLKRSVLLDDESPAPDGYHTMRYRVVFDGLKSRIFDDGELDHETLADAKKTLADYWDKQSIDYIAAGKLDIAVEYIRRLQWLVTASHPDLLPETAEAWHKMITGRA